MKRILSLYLSLVFIITSVLIVPVGVNAAPDLLIWPSAESLTTANFMSVNNDTSYMKFTESNFKFKTYIEDRTDGRINFESAKDISPYTHFNMWIHASDSFVYEKDGSIVRPILKFRLYDDTNTNMNTGLRLEEGTLTKPGWNLVSIPISQFLLRSGETVDKTKIKSMMLISNESGYPQFNKNITLYIDKIWCTDYKIESFDTLDSYPKSNDMSVSPLGESFSFALSDNIVKHDNFELSISSDGIDFSVLSDAHYSYNVDSSKPNILSLDLNYELEPNTSYYIKIKGVEDKYTQDANIVYSFKTAPDIIASKKPLFYVGSSPINSLSDINTGDNVTAKAYVKNYSLNSMQPVLYIASYDHDGTMLSISENTPETIVSQGGSELNATLAYDYIENAAKLCAFVCSDKNADTLSLIPNAFNSLPSNEVDIIAASDAVYPNEAASITLSKDSTVSGRFNINTNVPYSSVFLRLYKDATDVLLASLITDINGDCTYDTKIDISGDLRMYASINETTSDASRGIASDGIEFFNISQATKLSILSEINSAADYSQVKDALISDDAIREKELTIPSDSSFIDDVSYVIYGNKAYSNYDRIKLVIEKYKTVLSQIKAFGKDDWSLIAAYLNTNDADLACTKGSFVLSNNSDYKYFKALDASNQNKICEYMSSYLPVNGAKAFADKFALAVSAYKSALSQSKPSDPTPEYNPPPGGFSSSGGMGGGSGKPSYSVGGDALETVTPPSQKPLPAPAPFDDMSAYSWAKTAVDTLYEREIISKADNNKFRPSDKISREEFVKLIMCTIGLKGGAELSFGDVNDSEWYAPYIKSAVYSGIINGISDELFGIGEDIKRCDMALIIYRAASKINKDIPYDNSTSVFKDGSNIPQYSLDAVASLKAAGILNGDDMGCFNPLSSLTRAEAAMVIYNLINYLNI